MNSGSEIVIDIYMNMYAICICIPLYNHNSIFFLYYAIIFAVQFSIILFSFQPQLYHCCCQISVCVCVCLCVVCFWFCFWENIQFKIVFFSFFYQKGNSSRIRFYFRNKVRFHGRKKQSLGVEKVCSFSIALLKCAYALINLSMFGPSQWGKWPNLSLFSCLCKGKLSIWRAMRFLLRG